jgi:hypothetical protein
MLADLSTATSYTILARGDLEAADGNPDHALRYYRRARSTGRKDPDPQLAIARLEQSRGRYAEAQRAVMRARRWPRTTKTRRRFAGSSARLPRTGEAQLFGARPRSPSRSETLGGFGPSQIVNKDALKVFAGITAASFPLTVMVVPVPGT